MKTSETQKLNGHDHPGSENIRDILSKVHAALREKGYSPITQIVGYILSGDPTYITGHRNARGLIARIERDELLEEIVRAYLKEI